MAAEENFKVLVFGASSVGKSSIVAYGMNGSIYPRLIESPFPRSICLSNNVKFKIWEVPGHTYWDVAPYYYHNTHAALVVCDVTDILSIILAQGWVSVIPKLLQKDVIIAVAGNKIDIKEPSDDHHDKIRSYVSERDYIFMETSARTGENIQQIFEAMAEKLRRKSTFIQEKSSEETEEK